MDIKEYLNTSYTKNRFIDTSYTKTYNTIINKFDTFQEVVIYKKAFNVKYKGDGIINFETGEVSNNQNNVDRSRKFVEKGGVLHPVADVVTIDALQKTINDSCKRAKDNFYGYALANEWQYFCTFTIDQKNYGSDDDVIKYYWGIFLKRARRILGKQIKVLCVPERHEKTKVIHFHALIGDCDLTPHLKEAYDSKSGKLLKTKYGHQIYNINLWRYGFSTAVKIDSKDNYLQVANYLIGYTTKANNIGYNKKKYYRTMNLNFKDKRVVYLTDDEQKKLINSLFTVIYKENERMTVYRVYDKNKLKGD